MCHPRLTGALGGSPSRDQTLGACRGTAARERDGLDVLIQLCWLSEFHQHDVIVDGVPVVLWMGDDDGRCDELPGAVLVPDVVLTQMQLNVLTPERREQRER